MNTQEILERLGESDAELLKADGLDDAILGLAEGWFGNSQHAVICYDYDKCVEILVGRGMTEEEAEEWLGYNTLGAYVGPYTPVFVYNWRKENGAPEGAPNCHSLPSSQPDSTT